MSLSRTSSPLLAFIAFLLALSVVAAVAWVDARAPRPGSASPGTTVFFRGTVTTILASPDDTTTPDQPATAGEGSPSSRSTETSSTAITSTTLPAAESTSAVAASTQ
ncbi:MAG: hypothetical protein M5U22_05015 [Thermoleophilia bacterium]|nr:hypothetical protein [Thermoleophilia bacterium]